MHQGGGEDRDWIEGVRQAGRSEEDFQERKRLQDNNYSGSNSSGKRKWDESITVKITKKA